MTDFTSKMKALPDVVKQAIYNKKAISYSQAHTWHTCPLQGKFKYIDKIPQPPTDAMLYGSVFDSLTEGHLPDTTDLPPETVAIIKQRADEYLDQINPDEVRLSQYPVYALMDIGYWFYGWADDVFFDQDGGYLRLEDRKFSAEPWDDKKYKYYDKQAQCYIWALRQAGLDAVEMVFKVGNLREPGIQTFTYKPKMSTLMKIPDWLMDVARMAEDLIKPTGGRHCEWCPYEANCSEFLWNVQI